jgi:hypothetical protein
LVISPCHIGCFITLFAWEAGDNLVELADKDPEVIIAVFVERHIFSINKDVIPNSIGDKELVEETWALVILNFISAALITVLKILAYITI